MPRYAPRLATGREFVAGSTLELVNAQHLGAWHGAQLYRHGLQCGKRFPNSLGRSAPTSYALQMLLCGTARGEPDRTLHHRDPRGREVSSDNGDVIASSYRSRRSDHRINPGAGELTEVADLHPIVANERPKNVGILG